MNLLRWDKHSQSEFVPFVFFSSQFQSKRSWHFIFFFFCSRLLAPSGQRFISLTCADLLLLLLIPSSVCSAALAHSTWSSRCSSWNLLMTPPSASFLVVPCSFPLPFQRHNKWLISELFFPFIFFFFSCKRLDNDAVSSPFKGFMDACQRFFLLSLGWATCRVFSNKLHVLWVACSVVYGSDCCSWSRFENPADTNIWISHSVAKRMRVFDERLPPGAAKAQARSLRWYKCCLFDCLFDCEL